MKKLTDKQKLVLRELVNFRCQECDKPEEQIGTLEIHRIRRGNLGGKYVPNNLKIVCKSCHKLYHSQEFK
jgi:5-methylcytosine-specific restriction endonuclease McrA